MQSQITSLVVPLDPEIPFTDLLDVFSDGKAKMEFSLLSLTDGRPVALCNIQVLLIPLGASFDGPRRLRNAMELILQENLCRSLKPFEMLSLNRAFPDLQMVHPVVSDTLVLGIHPRKMALEGRSRGYYGHVMSTIHEFAGVGTFGEYVVACTPTDETRRTDFGGKKLDILLQAAWTRYGGRS